VEILENLKVKVKDELASLDPEAECQQKVNKKSEIEKKLID